MSSGGGPLIAHVIFRLDFGGLENGLVNIINRTAAMPIRHVVICLDGFSDFRRRILRPEVEVFSLNKQPGKDIGVYLRFWRILRRLRPDVVHTRNFGTIDLQWVAWAAGVKHRVHGEHGWDAGDLNGSNIRHLLIRRSCAPAIHRYVAVSKDIARWLVATVGVPARRITQINNGVDAERFSAEGTVAADLPWSREPSDGRVVFGTVGRFVPVKNQASLLEAFARLLKEEYGAACRLLIVGDGPLGAALRARAGECGIADKVWFTGFRDDLPELIRAIDVFVLPSLNEGISNTLLEAMAAGRPVVAGRVGGNPEIVDSDSCGILYDPADPNGLFAGMAAYCRDRDLRVLHGAAGRRSMQRRFSLSGMAEKYAGFYRTLTAA